LRAGTSTDIKLKVAGMASTTYRVRTEDGVVSTQMELEKGAVFGGR
jgi:hypothetical protein